MINTERIKTFLDPKHHIPVSLQLAVHITFGIFFRKYAPGTQLPSIYAMSKELGMESSDVADAYRFLLNNRVLTKRGFDEWYISIAPGLIGVMCEIRDIVRNPGPLNFLHELFKENFTMLVAILRELGLHKE